MDKFISGLKGVTKIVDDILVYASTLSILEKRTCAFLDQCFYQKSKFCVMFSICSFSFAWIAQWHLCQIRLIITFSVWLTRISNNRFLQFITATGNFPDREEVGFLLRFYRPSFCCIPQGSGKVFKKSFYLFVVVFLALTKAAERLPKIQILFSGAFRSR